LWQYGRPGGETVFDFHLGRGAALPFKRRRCSPARPTPRMQHNVTQIAKNTERNIACPETPKKTCNSSIFSMLGFDRPVRA
jgi:hypothetical protein